MTLRAELQKALDYAGVDIPAEKWLRDRIVVVIIATALVVAFVLFIVKQYGIFDPLIEIEKSVAVVIATFAIFGTTAWLSLYYKIEERRRRCNKILPDFLLVVSMNIRAGMEPLTALYVSLRPDFEPVASELAKIRSMSLGPKSVIEQLSLLTKRIDSSALRTTVAIIERGMRAGGNLAALLDSVAYDLRETNRLCAELETATRGPLYFIIFLVLIGVPLLLSVAERFIKFAMMPPTPGAGFAAFGELIGVAITPHPGIADVTAKFLVLIAASAVSASLMYGVIRGEAIYGTKYIPIILPLAIAAYFVFGRAVAGLFEFFGI